MHQKVICGIDYGSKLAGTTALAFNVDKRIQIVQSAKKSCADTFLLEQLSLINPCLVGIDAPLTLPGKYHGQGDNYFYRKCDQQLKAMSPMFIGGLTARAIKFKDQLCKQGIDTIEVYPKALVKMLDIDQKSYKKNIEHFRTYLSNIFLPYLIPDHIHNWHQIDSLLAWWSTHRYHSKEARGYGNADEGLIYV